MYSHSCPGASPARSRPQFSIAPGAEVTCWVPACMSRKYCCRRPDRSAVVPAARYTATLISSAAQVAWYSARRVIVRCSWLSVPPPAIVSPTPRHVSSMNARAACHLASASPYSVWNAVLSASVPGSAGLRLDQRRQLVEHPPGHAECPSRVADHGEVHDPEMEQRATRARPSRPGPKWVKPSGT